MNILFHRIFVLRTNIAVFFIILLIATSCKKLIEVDAPVTSVNSENVFKNDGTAAALITGIYTNISQSSFSNGIVSLSLMPSLSADELTLYDYSNQSLQLRSYYSNALSSTNTGAFDFWNTLYSTIFVVNSAIEGLTQSTSLTPSIKSQLLGEAKFIRAFCYFYLVNLYGDVPLTNTSNYEVNRILARTSKADVYLQIIEDLKSAKDLLANGYLKADRLTIYPNSNVERIHPNTWTARALLSRAFLYSGDFANAEMEATAIINNKIMYDTVPLSNTFLKNNKEAIWQLQPVIANTNTQNARMFVLPSTGPNTSNNPVYLSDELLNGFENSDKRKAIWVNSVTVNSKTYFYSNKYKNASSGSVVTEYLTVFRLGEQYLIRSEARTQQGNFGDALSDLNVIRIRAGLPLSNAADKASLLSAIEKERRVELFTEWGHRWFDIKRTNRVDAIMNLITPQKNGSWSSNWAWYPIPQYELTKNPALEGQQNFGY